MIDKKQIIALIKEIESRKEHIHAACTYQDSYALKIIEDYLNSLLQQYNYNILDAIFLARYLANNYEKMWRIKYSIHYYNLLIQLHLKAYNQDQMIDQDIYDDYYHALRARNYYFKDDCSDLVEIAKKILNTTKREKIEKQVLYEFQPLTHDPIELSDEYLQVIDEVEKAIDDIKDHQVFFFEKMTLMKQLLLEKGIVWHSIIELNPNYHFD